MPKVKFTKDYLKQLEARAKLLPDTFRLKPDGVTIATYPVKVLGSKIKNNPTLYGVNVWDIVKLNIYKYYDINAFAPIDKFQFLKSWVMQHGVDDPMVLAKAEKAYMANYKKVKEILRGKELDIQNKSQKPAASPGDSGKGGRG